MIYGQNRNNMDWIMVANVDQVESVNVVPGGKAWIMVQNEPIFALRTADMMGLVTTEYYHFEKYEPKRKSQFITSDELTEALTKLKGELHESINDLITASNRAKSE